MSRFSTLMELMVSFVAFLRLSFRSPVSRPITSQSVPLWMEELLQ